MDRWERAERRESRRDHQPRVNWGHIRREQAFEAKRHRDALRAQWRAERHNWNTERRQRRFEDSIFRQVERYRQSDQRYYNPQRVEVWFGDDYSDYDRYNRYTVYTPTYRTSDYVYGDYPSYTTNVYDDDFYYDYADDDGFDWKSLLFRSVISAFFSNTDNIGYLDPYPRYGSSHDDGYYGYVPQYRYQPPYYTFGHVPNYAYYEPAAYYGYDQFSS